MGRLSKVDMGGNYQILHKGIMTENIKQKLINLDDKIK